MINSTPHAILRHWASGLIGKPWVLAAVGPDSFDCWGIVVFVQKEHYGRDVPNLSTVVGSWSHIRDLAQRSNWNRVDDQRDGDVMLMTSRVGPHIGVLVEADGQLGLLHAMGYRDPQGRDHGDVVFSPLSSLPSLGYGRFETWRHG